MSQENVEVVQPLYEAWGRGDYQSGLEVLHPDIEWTAAADIPGGDCVCHGREAVRAFLIEWRGAWSEYRVQVREFIDLDLHHQVLVLAHEYGRGKTSGADVETEFAQLWTIRDGLAVQMQEWRNWHEALEALGLSEQKPSYDNVAIVHRARDAFNRRDFDALAEMSHEDLEFESLLAAVDAESTYRGPETWPTYFARMDEAWEDWQVEDFRPIDAGDDRVVAIYRLTGTGKGSGVRVQQTAGMVYWLRDGKIWRLKSYLDQVKALEAVGLSEQDAHADS